MEARSQTQHAAVGKVGMARNPAHEYVVGGHHGKANAGQLLFEAQLVEDVEQVLAPAGQREQAKKQAKQCAFFHVSKLQLLLWFTNNKMSCSTCACGFGIKRCLKSLFGTNVPTASRVFQPLNHIFGY